MYHEATKTVQTDFELITSLLSNDVKKKKKKKKKKTRQIKNDLCIIKDITRLEKEKKSICRLLNFYPAC